MGSINFHLSAASLIDTTGFHNDTQATLGSSVEQGTAEVEDMELDEDDVDGDKNSSEICSESSPDSEVDESGSSCVNSVVEQSCVDETGGSVILQSSVEDDDDEEHSPNNIHETCDADELERSIGEPNAMGEEGALADASFQSGTTAEDTMDSSILDENEEEEGNDDDFLVTPLKPMNGIWKTSTPFVRLQQHQTFQEPMFESTPRRDVGASYYVGNNSRYTFYESACSRYFNSIGGDESKGAEQRFETPCASIMVKDSSRMSSKTNLRKLSTVGPETVQYKNVFEDPKVISTICKYAINVSDLSNLRQVNKTWWMQATKRMVERNKLCLCFNGSNDKVPQAESLHGGVEKKYYSLEDLKNFNDVLSAKKSFVPVHRIVLYQVDFEDPEVLRFFRLHGQSITHLKIVFRPDTVKYKFWAVFTSHLPKLTVLELSHFPPAWIKDELAYAHSCYFEHLLGVKFDETFPGQMPLGAEDVIQAIIQGAEKLQHLVNYPVFLNPVVQKERKVHTIKSLVFNPDSTTMGRQLDNFMSLTAVRHRLEQITLKELEKYAFTPMNPEETEVLDNLLYMNRKSLTVLHMQPLGFCGKVAMRGKYSTLQCLRLFCLSAKVKRRSCVNTSFFPHGIGDMSLKFPKLTRVEIHDLECKYFASDFPATVFYPNCLPQVRSLVLDFLPTGVGTLEEWKRFAEIMPNIEHLTLKVPLASLGEVLHRSWKNWEKVEYLVIYIKEDGHQYTYPFLDEIITGVTEKYCKRLRLKKVRYADTLVNTFRTNHSVKDVKNLKTLDFVFEFQDDFERHIRGCPGIMSFLAALYGFQHGDKPIKVMYKCVRGKTCSN